MIRIESTLDINASPAELWKTLMDFKSYPEWNPFLISIEGTGKVGSQLNNVIQMKNGKTQKFTPRVLKNRENQEFRWLGHLFVKGLFDGEHYFLLKPKSANCTELIHGEYFSGLLAKPILSLIKEDTLDGFVKMNEALKQRTEQANIENTIK